MAPTTIDKFCNGCGGGCGDCGDCERCNFGIVCHECGGSGIVHVDISPNPKQAEKEEAEDDFGSRFTGPTLRIVVGPETGTRKVYYLHKKLLCQRSPYFATLLSFPGTESQENEVKLSEPVDTNDAFRLFVEFLYLADYTPKMEENVEDSALIHGKVYVLAERLCMPDLKELALKKAIEHLSKLVQPAAQRTGACPQAGYQRHCHPPGSGGAIYCHCDYFDHKAGAPIIPDNLPLETVVQLVEVVYSNTPDHYPIQSTEDEKMSGLQTSGADSAGKTPSVPSERPKDRMRVLVSRFCASILRKLKLVPEFSELVRDFGEFAEDLMQASGDGKRVESDELSRL